MYYPAAGLWCFPGKSSAAGIAAAFGLGYAEQFEDLIGPRKVQWLLQNPDS